MRKLISIKRDCDKEFYKKLWDQGFELSGKIVLLTEDFQEIVWRIL